MSRRTHQLGDKRRWSWDHSSGDEHAGPPFSATGRDGRGRLRAPDGRHTERYGGTTRAGHVLQGGPGVPTRRATNDEETTLHAGVGDKVVGRRVSHGHVHDVTRA